MKNPLKNWQRKIKRSFIKNFPLSLINIILIPLFIYLMMGLVVGFGIFPLLGYLFYSIINLNKLIEKPWKSLIWGIIYMISAILFEAFLRHVLPLLSKGDGASIFSGIILGSLLIFLWVKNRSFK
jgi:hypothetical protein